MFPLLITFMKWILLSPTTDLNINASRVLVVEHRIKATTQFVSQNIKTSRESQYYIETSSKTLYSKIETPLNVELGSYVYHITRSKKFINFLTDLNVGVP